MNTFFGINLRSGMFLKLTNYGLGYSECYRSAWPRIVYSQIHFLTTQTKHRQIRKYESMQNCPYTVKTLMKFFVVDLAFKIVEVVIYNLKVKSPALKFQIGLCVVNHFIS